MYYIFTNVLYVISNKYNFDLLIKLFSAKSNKPAMNCFFNLKDLKIKKTL